MIISKGQHEVKVNALLLTIWQLSENQPSWRQGKLLCLFHIWNILYWVNTWKICWVCADNFTCWYFAFMCCYFKNICWYLFITCWYFVFLCWYLKIPWWCLNIICWYFFIICWYLFITCWYFAFYVLILLHYMLILHYTLILYCKVILKIGTRRLGIEIC